VSLFGVAGMFLAPSTDGTATNSANIDSALVLGTSGDSWCLRFQADVGQSSATLSLYLYCSAVTGTPTFEMEVHVTQVADQDRPDTGAAISSSPNSITPTANTWTDAFTCTVSLTQDASYFVIVKNTTADPVNNHAAFRYRGALTAIGPNPTAVVSAIRSAGFNQDGYTTDPTLSGDVGGAYGGGYVLKYSDGTLVGNPYVTDDSAHANNTNDRGNRFTFTEDVSCIGINSGQIPGTALANLEVNAASDGTNIKTIAVTAFAESQSGAGLASAFTLTGGTAYDIVSTFSANSTSGTIYTMGEAEGNVPADVIACRPWSCAYVDGATPGSYTADTSKLMLLTGVLVNDFPAIAGGGGNANVFGA